MSKAPSVTWLDLILRVMAIPLLFAGLAWAAVAFRMADAALRMMATGVRREAA
jgi:hypothetical protein